jgi:hypothetical protein
MNDEKILSRLRGAQNAKFERPAVYIQTSSRISLW